MALQKNDFIEVEFTGRVKDTGEIFDSNIKEDLEKSGLGEKGQTVKPFVFSLGQGMFLPSVENFLLGKPDTSAKYEIELSPENAFGMRDAKLLQIIPLKAFYEQKLNPVPGIMFNFDGRLAKVLSVSGGRVRVDFNHPIAGKTVIYDVSIKRKINDLNEKIKNFIDFIFRKELDFQVKEKELILEIEKPMAKFAELFADKFKEIFNLDLKVKEIEVELKEVEKIGEEIEEISKKKE